MNTTERKIFNKLNEMFPGDVTRNGWPDFGVIKNRLVVEVKAGKDVLSLEQRRVAKYFIELGWTYMVARVVDGNIAFDTYDTNNFLEGWARAELWAVLRSKGDVPGN